MEEAYCRHLRPASGGGGGGSSGYPRRPDEQPPRTADSTDSAAVPGVVVLSRGIAATTVSCPSGSSVVVFNPTRGDATVQSGTQAVLLKPGEGASIADSSDATPIVFTALATGISFALFPRKGGGHHGAAASAAAETGVPAAPKIELLDAATVRNMQNVPTFPPDTISKAGTQPGLSSAAGGAASAGAPAGQAASAGAAQTATPVIREVVRGPLGVTGDSFGLYGTEASSSTAPMTVRGANLENGDLRLCATYEDGRKIAYYADEFARVVDERGQTIEKAVSFAGIENKTDIRQAAVQAVDGTGAVVSEFPVKPLDASISVTMPETAPPGSTIAARIDYSNYLKCANAECYGFDPANYELQLAAEPSDLEHPPTALLNPSGQTQVPVRIPTTVLGVRRWTFSAILSARAARVQSDSNRGTETADQVENGRLEK